MKGQASSLISIVLLSMLIFLLSSELVEARILQQICSSSCGDNHNISYPFRLKGDPTGCGDPDYELSCENNKTILEFYSGKYYVKQISYDKYTIRVVDVNFANNKSCSLPYGSVTVDEVMSDTRYRGLVSHSYTSFVNCSRTINDIGYRLVPCLSGNLSNVYAIYGSNMSDFQDSCTFISMALAAYEDVKYPSYETILKMLRVRV